MSLFAVLTILLVPNFSALQNKYYLLLLYNYLDVLNHLKTYRINLNPIIGVSIGLWTKRAGFWASFIHSISSFNIVIWFIISHGIFSGTHPQSPTVIFSYGHSRSTTQHENFDLLHWCVIIVQWVDNDCRLVSNQEH